MSEKQSKEILSRRGALRIIAGSVGASISCPILKGSTVCGTTHLHALGPAAKSSPYATKFFNKEQMQTIDVLSEIIIPADEHSPGARAARVYQYIDEIIAGSSEKQKAFWVEGLAALDKMAVLKHGKEFRDCTREQQQALVESISEHEDHSTTLEERFFGAVKNATVNGYYNSEIGIHQELDYQGNTVLLDFDGCKHEEHKS